MTLINHLILSVSDTDPESEANLIQTLDSGYEVVNSAVLPDGTVRYVLRRMVRDGWYSQPGNQTDELGLPLDLPTFPEDRK